MSTQKHQAGFTLIELMIVVVIIGILASIAIPFFVGYVTRSRWAEAVAGTASLKTAIAECIQANNGDASLCDESSELAAFGISTVPQTKFRDVTVAVARDSGAITISSTGRDLGTCTLSITPTVGGANIIWAISIAGGSDCTRPKTGFGS
jgi:type IV pilus assembly protein PilA